MGDEDLLFCDLEAGVVPPFLFHFDLCNIVRNIDFFEFRARFLAKCLRFLRIRAAYKLDLRHTLLPILLVEEIKLLDIILFLILLLSR